MSLDLINRQKARRHVTTLGRMIALAEKAASNAMAADDAKTATEKRNEALSYREQRNWLHTLLGRSPTAGFMPPAAFSALYGVRS